MKKKSASQSAFFNLRILVGLFLAMVGVFLALFATSANSLYRGASPAGSGGSILFNQITGNTLGSVPAQRFVPPGPLDGEAADDFEVFDAQGWTIGQFNFEIGVVASEPDGGHSRVSRRQRPAGRAGPLQLQRDWHHRARRQPQPTAGSVADTMCARPGPLLGVPRAERRFGDAMGCGIT